MESSSRLVRIRNVAPAVPELVSIVTPFHDDLRFFDDTIASVFGQTYPEWEWLLVDDGSEPGYAERAKHSLPPIPSDSGISVSLTALATAGPRRATSA